MSRWRLSLLSLLLVTMTFPVLAWASAAGIHLEMEAGWQGYYRPGHWFPVRLRLENKGVAIDAELVVRLGEQRLTLPVSLPAPTTRQLYVELLGEYAATHLSVELRADGRTQATVQERLIALRSAQPLILALTADAWADATLASRYHLAAPSRLVRLSAAALPDGWQGYESVAALVVDTHAPGVFSTLQQQALRQWLLLGGLLLFVERDPEEREASLTHLLGASVGSLWRLPKTTSAMVEIGMGWVLFAREMSKTLIPAGSLELPGAWQDWLGQEPLVTRTSVATLDRQLLQRLPSDSGEARAPILWTQGGFAALYLAVTVLILWGGSRYSAWQSYLVLAGASLLFAWLAGLAGILAYPGELRSQEVSLLHVFPNQGESFAATAATLLAPARQTYHLQALAPASSMAVAASGGVAPQLAYARAGPPDAAALHLSMALWGQRQVHLQQFFSAGPFTMDSGVHSSRLTNGSSGALQHCHLLSTAGLYQLADIPAGQTMQLGLPEGHPPVAFLPARGPLAVLAGLVSHYRQALRTDRAQEMVVCLGADGMPALRSTEGTLRSRGTTVVMYHRRQTGGS